MLAAVVLLILGAHSSVVAGFAISKALPLPTRTSRVQVCSAFTFKSPCVERSSGLLNWTPTSKQDEIARIELLQLIDKMSTVDALHLVEWQARNMSPTLQMLFEVFTQLSTAWRSTRAVDKPEGLQWPVLVIDYANLLMNWTDEHPAELSQLLKYLNQLTKYKLCHVLLVVSSEYHFTQWLHDREEIDATDYNIAIIGNFQEHTARAYLQFELDADTTMVSDEEWSAVYELYEQ
eukprot:10991-Heterococcus_DN1.PRE.1